MVNFISINKQPWNQMEPTLNNLVFISILSNRDNPCILSGSKNRNGKKQLIHKKS